jgi:hypothetical protein
MKVNDKPSIPNNKPLLISELLKPKGFNELNNSKLNWKLFEKVLKLIYNTTINNNNKFEANK